MASPKDNAKWEAKQRAAGWVRGPRITAEAQARLHDLAFQYKLAPAEVSSRLILGIPLERGNVARQQFAVMGGQAARDAAAMQAREGLSEAEMAAFQRLGGSGV